MNSTGTIATSGYTIRMASKTPDKFGARNGFIADTNLVQSNTPADDNGATKLGNLSNPIIRIGGVVYNISAVSQFNVNQFLTLKDPNADLVQSDVTSIKTRFGTILTSAPYTGFSHNNGFSTWTFTFVFGGVSPPNIFDPLLTSSTSSFSFLEIT